MTYPIGIRTYPAQAAARRPLIDFMLDALKGAGCRIIHEPSPDVAPFVVTFETQSGERMGVVAYAFLATRTPTKNRPADERSFQIKYGPNDNALHELWQDPLGIYTTLFLGIDPEEGFFVAVDPEIHNPTRFFIRMEFKDNHAEEIKQNGWYAWERQSRGPRHLLPNERLFGHETLVGGTQARFLDLVRFERLALGLPPGDRHLLADQFTSAVPMVAPAHPLVTEFELESDQILELIAGARRLKMAVRGWVAEEKLREALANTPGVTHCKRLDDEGGPDLSVRWQDGVPLTIECKNVLRKTNAAGLARIDFQRTRASKQDPCSRYYAASDFDLLAGCLHAITENWEFRFIRPIELAPRPECPGKLDNKVLIDGNWTSDAGQAFEQAYAALDS